MTTDQQKTGGDYKFNAVKAEGTSSFAAYRRIMYGETSLGYVIMAELIVLCFSWVPGALGLLLRKWFYPLLFKQTGGGVVFGRNMTLRHARKISLGAGVVLDDNVVLDAKGDTNDGITIGDGVYIGRNTIIYCKNGNIHLENNVNISSNCQLFSANDLRVGEGSVIAAYVCMLPLAPQR